MGSEMCIRDRPGIGGSGCRIGRQIGAERGDDGIRGHRAIQVVACLLYTSDAADERSSVDLGGRRILKKKNRIGGGCVERGCRRHEQVENELARTQ